MPSTTQNSTPSHGLGRRYREVQDRIAKAAIAADRDVHSITLLAVTKGQTVPVIRAAVELGLVNLGENYVDEALGKIKALQGSLAQWHFIGRLQANKTRAVAENFAWVHSVDRLHTARRLAGQRPPQLPALNVCVQVRVARDPAKGGVDPDTSLALLQQVSALPGLRLRGLMCMLPHAMPAAAQHHAFASLRTLFDTARQAGHALDTLSMGMSGDLEAAIAEGATIVRVGTALFGPRAT